MSRHIDFKFPCGCFSVNGGVFGFQSAMDYAAEKIAYHLTAVIDGDNKTRGCAVLGDDIGTVRFVHTKEASFASDPHDRNLHNSCSIEYDIKSEMFDDNSLAGIVDEHKDCRACDIQDPSACLRPLVRAIRRWQNESASQR